MPLAVSMVVSPGLECKCSAQSKLIPGDNPWTGHPFEPAEMECYLQFQSKHWIYLPQIKPNLGILQRENDRERQRERGVFHCSSSVRVSSVSLLGIYLVCSSLLAAVVESIIPSFSSTSSPPRSHHYVACLSNCFTVPACHGNHLIASGRQRRCHWLRLCRSIKNEQEPKPFNCNSTTV